MNDASPQSSPQPSENVSAELAAGEVRAQPPEEFTGLRTTAMKKAAVGAASVVTAMTRVWREMGLSRGLRGLLALNQPRGIDCMSCAWADPDEGRGIVEFCENGAKALAWEGDSDRAGPAFFAEHSVAQLSQRSDYWLGQQGRLTHPMLLRPGGTHYQPIPWDEAFSLVAAELGALASPDEAIFYTSGRTSNEAAFLYQLFVRQFGTNNLPDCSNMCHESSGSALSLAIGIGKGTVTLGDFDRAQVILILGQNPGTNHPRMLLALQRAKRHGCKIIAINPLPEAGLMRFKNPQEVVGLLGPGTALADLFLQVRINGDSALLKGLMKAIVEEEARRPGAALDLDFIREQTTGFDALASDLRNLQWPAIIQQSGISGDRIREAATLLVQSQRIITCWAMGLTQHRNAVATIQEIVNLHLMRGAIGKPGAGVCPVRGHSNVQGDRTMGIWERPTKEFLDKLQEVFGFDPPRKFGYDTVEAIRAMHAGQAKVFFALGGNFLSAAPDTEFTAAALRRCADRPSLDETEPRPPCHRPPGGHSSLPGTKRARSPGLGSATGFVRELHGGCSIITGQPGTGVGAFAQRAGHRCQARPGRLARSRARAVAAAHRELRPHPGPDRARGPRIRAI